MTERTECTIIEWWCQLLGAGIFILGIILGIWMLLDKGLAPDFLRFGLVPVLWGVGLCLAGVPFWNRISFRKTRLMAYGLIVFGVVLIAYRYFSGN